MRTVVAMLALGLGIAALLSPALSAAETVFNVDTTVDDPSLGACDDATPGDCSLRGAIGKANGLSNPVTINLPAGRYVLTQSTPCAFRGASIGPLFTALGLCPLGTLTIAGAGAGTTIIDGNQPPGQNFTLDTIMFVAIGANVTVQGVTIRGGNFSVGFLEGAGGGINNAGTLTLADSIVTKNWSSGDAGGIYNQGNLTLLRTQVTQNVASYGGGIFNANLFGTCQVLSPCHDGQGVLSITDSTISDNVAASLGGGIYNSVGMIDVTGSTISGNVATSGSGGAIYNSAWNVNLTNVTISGNRANDGGGIANAGYTYSTLSLNNVTITNNTAQWSTDPTRGLGGGVYDGSGITIQNTIIAGNFAAGDCGLNGCLPPGSDCFASATANSALTSLGYNLIADPQGCDLVGDTTGNLTGVDAKLGLLTDNGGPTLTHALANDSPAIDAGSPAAPGSGGGACAVTDQRGFLRPLGPRCDIGAYERSPAFAIANVVPAGGGNTGQVTVQIDGGGFVDGATVRLRRSGQPDIVGVRTQVDIGGAAIATSFDLTSAAPGVWDVVVTDPDSTAVTLSGGFTITPGVGPSMWVDVIGIIRRETPSTIVVLYGNRGDTDAIGVPLSLSLPQGYEVVRYFAVTPPPAQPGEQRPDWSAIPEGVALPGQSSFLQVPLFLPVVPTGFSGVLRLGLMLPPNATDTFMLGAVGDPIVTPASTSSFVDAAVGGAESYLQQVFAIAVAATVVPQMQSYATTQLQTMIADGEAAFAASLGTAPQVYSLGQFQLDLAFFAAPRTSP